MPKVVSTVTMPERLTGQMGKHRLSVQKSVPAARTVGLIREIPATMLLDLSAGEKGCEPCNMCS
jgi:hypothetical protein